MRQRYDNNRKRKMSKTKECVMNNRRKNLALVLSTSLIIALVLLLLFPSIIKLHDKSDDSDDGDTVARPSVTRILIECPDELYLKFFNSSVLSWQSNFMIYRLMISGVIHGGMQENIDMINGIYENYFIMNFASQELLSYYFDLNSTEVENYIRSGKPKFNGMTLRYDITRDKKPNFIGIRAFDLSIANQTTIQDEFDFGNTVFATLKPGETNNIKIDFIDCTWINNTSYVPYLNLTINGEKIRERMAWNRTIDLSSW